MSKTDYIAGPMRGYKNFNFETFDAVEGVLWSVGRIPINPAAHDREVYPDIETWPGFATGDIDKCPEFDYVATITWDLQQVLAADRIVMLPGWEQSSGATHERYVAEVAGKEMVLAKKSRSGEWYFDHDPHKTVSTRPSKTIYRAATLPEARELILKDGGYITKDSGARVDYPSGMRRDVDTDKPRYDLIPVMPHRRLAELYARGAEKYGDNNWRLANSDEEARRFRASAERHFMQWKNGEDDEDHAIAVVWNIYAALVTEAKTPPETKSAGPFVADL